jgi:hypothetical protein
MCRRQKYGRGSSKPAPALDKNLQGRLSDLISGIAPHISTRRRETGRQSAWQTNEIWRVYGQESMPIYAGIRDLPKKFSEAEKLCLLDCEFPSAGRLSP